MRSGTAGRCCSLCGRSRLKMAAIHRWIKNKKESQMTMLKGIAAAALVLGPTFAFAATPGYLDGYYIADSKLKLEGSGASADDNGDGFGRSEEHTSELQSLMRISYAVFCLKKK